MRNLFITCVVLIGLSSPGAAIAAPIDGTFSYQGRLTDAGAPVTGAADLRFRLYDAAGGGSQIGSQITETSVTVTGGLFNVPLDFGVDALNGDERWLEIDARTPSGVGSYVNLGRQPLLGTPYAIQTRGIFVDDANNVGIGTITPLDDVHVASPGARLRIEDTASPNSYTVIEDTIATQMRINKHNESGDTFLDLNPVSEDGTSTALVRFFRSTDSTGVKGLRLHRGDNTAALSGFIGVDGQDSALQLHGGNIGIGTSTPSIGRLHAVAGPGEGNAIYGETESGSASSAIRGEGHSGGDGVEGRAFTSIGAGVRGTNVSSDGSGVVGHSSTVFPGGVGVRGIADTAGGFDFLADGAGTDYGSSSSIRWKSNIEPIVDPLGKLTQIRGVYYDWDEAHGGHHDVGMIAEEVGKVLPEIVKYEKNGVDAKGMDYSKLSPLLVEAVKELRAEKDAEIAELREENRELRERLDYLERLIEKNTAEATAARIP